MQPAGLNLGGLPVRIQVVHHNVTSRGFDQGVIVPDFEILQIGVALIPEVEP